jgi:signal transduction histidine kinase
MTLRRKVALASVALLVVVGVQGATASVLLTQAVEGVAQLVRPALGRVDTLAHLEADVLRLHALQHSAAGADEEIAQLRVDIARRLDNYASQDIDIQRAGMIASIRSRYATLSTLPVADSEAAFLALDDELHQLRHVEYAVSEALRDRMVSAALWARWPLGLAAVIVAVAELALLWSISRARLEAQRASLMRERVAHIVQAQEAERARVARELHDEAGQAVTALNYGLEHLRRIAPDARVRIEVERLIELGGETTRQVAALARDLRPAVLDDLGLMPALRSLVRDFSNRYDVSVELEAPNNVPRLGAEAETAVYRVVQEALTNVARHARAHHAHVRVDTYGDHLRVEVHDDGRGFDANAARTGLGLAGIQERVQLLSGVFDVMSSTGQGTQVAMSIPVGSLARA